MTVRFCDACGVEIKDPEIGETLVISGIFNYDLCDGCGQTFFAILKHQTWKRPLAPSELPVGIKETA